MNKSYVLKQCVRECPTAVPCSLRLADQHDWIDASFYLKKYAAKAMHACTYTAQKGKKSRRWKDGTVSIKGKYLNLKDEEGRKVCSSVSYTIVDDMIETHTYLIYTDACPLNEDAAEVDAEPRAEPQCQTALRAKKEEPARPKEPTEAAESECGIMPGRSADEIIELFKRPTQ